MATRKPVRKVKKVVQKKGLSKKQKVGVGAAVAVTAAAAAAGAYFFYGSKNAGKNRKMAKGLVDSAKKEVKAQVNRAKKELSKSDYNKMVDQAMKKYRQMSSASSTEVNRLAGELKKEWVHMQKVAKKRMADKPRRPAKRKAKKRTVKKVTKRKTTKKGPTRR